jgi:hypothetical protein
MNWLDKAQRGKGTPVVLTDDDFERALALLRLNPFSESSKAQTDPALPPSPFAGVLAREQDTPQEASTKKAIGRDTKTLDMFSEETSKPILA